jgi:hypothetical protein
MPIGPLVIMAFFDGAVVAFIVSYFTWGIRDQGTRRARIRSFHRTTDRVVRDHR